MKQTVAPGIYRHYKGGLYTVVGVVKHHDTRADHVLYFSHAKGSLNVRPFHGSARDPDGWFDQVLDTASGEMVERFTYVGPTP